MKYTKTEVGQQAFKERSPLLTSRQRSAFILFDGAKPIEEVLKATSALGITTADIEHMLDQGFIEPVFKSHGGTSKPAPLAPVVDIPLDGESQVLPRQRYAAAYPLATKLTASLGLRGFKLNLAVEAAAGYDDLLALLPKIEAAVGADACRELAQALKG